MTNSRLHTLDIRLLRYFAVVAEENNISRAAQRLFISAAAAEPSIFAIWKRSWGNAILAAYQRSDPYRRGKTGAGYHSASAGASGSHPDGVEPASAPAQQPLRLGLTTAFEQGIFAAAESALGEYTSALHITRQSSPALAQLVRKGKLDAALVALPLNTEGLHLHPLSYQEPLIAALPASWPEAARAELTLTHSIIGRCSGLNASVIPIFFDYTRRFF